MDLDFSNQTNKKIEVIEKTKTRLIDIETITYLDCNGYVTTIHLLNFETYSTSKLLKCFENELKEYGFIRANRSTLVNPRCITLIQSSFGRKIH